MANKRVVIDPITRIEGHLRIEVEVDENNVVQKAYSSSTLWRGIELILKGRDPRDAGLMAQRICGVCTYSHYKAGIEAVENALDVERPTTPSWCVPCLTSRFTCTTTSFTSATGWTGSTSSPP